MAKEKRFEAVGRKVYHLPVRSGPGATMGFEALEICEFVADAEEVAKTVAAILNERWVDE